MFSLFPIADNLLSINQNSETSILFIGIFKKIFSENTSTFERTILIIFAILILLIVISYFVKIPKVNKLFPKSFSSQESPNMLESMHLDLIYGKNTKVHRKISIKIIDNTPDQELINVIEKNLFLKYCTDFDNMYKIIKKWNSSRQFFYILDSFDKSILPDGGFEDFYHLSNAELNEVLPQAFKKIGMNEIALIVEKANYKFELDKKNYTETFEKYWLDETEKIPKPKGFNELNKELFKVYNQDKIKLKLIHFIRNNKNDFID